MDVQAVWFRSDKYSKTEAAAWCVDHDFITNVYRQRVEGEVVTHHIFPQFDTSEGVDGTWATLSNDFPDGVSVSVCERKKSMDIQHTKGVQSADDPFEFVMSDESVDRVGDVIRANGWDLNSFEKNPVALFGHNHEKPIGVWENVRVVGKKLVGRLKLAKQGTSAEIDTIRSLVEQRILKAVSVGFQPIEAKPMKSGGYEFIKQALHECSLVSVPANANALAIAKSFGADPAKVFATDHGGEIRGLTKKADPAIGAKLAIINEAIGNIEKHLRK